MSSQDVKNIQSELKWVTIQESEKNSFSQKLKSKGLTGFLVPAGCLVTSGILATGLYQLKQRNQRSQQMLMRYRIAAQGITVLIAMIGIVTAPIKKTKSM